jgi:TadE-like protein
MTRTDVVLRRGERGRSESGQALVEFALVLVPLMLIIVAIVQFGFWFQARSALRDGVRAAARQAALCRSQTSPTPEQVYEGIVSSSMANPNPPVIVYGGSGDCSVGNPVTVTGAYNYPINILGIIQVSGTALNATAESIVE